MGQEAEAWLLGIKKSFQVHDYLGNMKERVSIFNLVEIEPSDRLILLTTINN